MVGEHLYFVKRKEREYEKRVLSLALALMMCLGLAVPAIATETQSNTTGPVTLNMLKNDFIFEGGIVRAEWNVYKTPIFGTTKEETGWKTVKEVTVYIPLGSKVSLAPLAIADNFRMLVFKDYNQPAIIEEISSYTFNMEGNFKIGTYAEITDKGILLIYDMDVVVVNESAIKTKAPFLDISYFDEPYEITVLYNKKAHITIPPTFREDIEWVYERGISTGTSATTFSPFDTVTRAQLVQMLWNYSGKPEPKYIGLPFQDVKGTDWYYKALCWAYETGVIKDVFVAENFEPTWACSTSHAIQTLNNLFCCQIPDTIHDGEIANKGLQFCLRVNLAHYLHYAHQFVTSTLNG